MGKDVTRSIASGGSPDLQPVRSEHSGAFVRLSRLWQHRSHFSLIFVAVDNPAYRDALIARLAALGAATRVDLHEGDAASAWLGAAQKGQVAGVTRLHLCLPLDKPRLDTWWQQANLLRERLADALPGVQVLWVSESDADRAAREASDLWNWREAVLSFTAGAPRGVPPVPGIRFDVATEADAAAVVERVAVIEHYLAASDGDDLASAHLRLEAARAYDRLGQWDRGIEHAKQAAVAYAAHGNESGAAAAKATLAGVLHRRGQPDQALRLLEDEVLPVFQRLGDEHLKAATMGRVADILQARGQLDEALRIRTEEVLPVFERLGDVREKAIVMGRIANILRARGQLDEALRIRTEEELPIYERLGDGRAKAVTMGGVADILHDRAQLGEALRIRTEEQLPVYERLGDVHAKAVTMGKIADILQARGQLDEALRICTEEVLAVYERLGDAYGKAVTMGRIADILQTRGQLDEARQWASEAREVFVRLKDSAGIAFCEKLLRRIQAAGHGDAA